MNIQNNMGMREILNSYETRDWLKSTKVDGVNNKMKLSDAPESTDIAGLQTKSFGDFLLDSVSKVNNLQQDANLQIEKLATGQSKNIHETMLAVERAELAFKSMNQVRTKVIDAYKEIMRMQL